jgi:hypothetical protein
VFAGGKDDFAVANDEAIDRRRGLAAASDTNVAPQSDWWISSLVNARGFASSKSSSNASSFGPPWTTAPRQVNSRLARSNTQSPNAALVIWHASVRLVT